MIKFFSWDDMAAKDIPAVIEYIKQQTGVEQLHYAGHSQGTMIAFAGFSQNQELAKSIKKFYGLAPVAFLGNMKSPLKYLAAVTPELEVLTCYHFRQTRGGQAVSTRHHAG